MDTIANVEKVRWAGGFDAKVSADTIQFYLDLTSILFREMIGDENYDKAVAGTLTALDNLRLEKAEALMAVAFSVPALATPIGQTGMVRMERVGVGGNIEVFSFTREVMNYAANFMNMGRRMIPEAYILDSEAYKEVWSEVVLRVFPGLDELPTQATIASEAEVLLQDARGDRAYFPGEG